MPCRECGKSAKRHGGACVGLSYDDDGTARYSCLTCVTDALKERFE
ncbi:hypothetical protein JMJ58_19460 [Haloterrigena salifodinae]|uniref:Uncharacterized protein n=1 Tax=Haloterrigena salifodinae TaxID=2675099 RepID=A0A8T8DZZ5_9EURY|nr:hypothetical protein [Haloterrigena salifodinae]QRV15059.1 hypothetical protein JMJ58_19460 [Haloterrigena salifodinae]